MKDRLFKIQKAFIRDRGVTVGDISLTETARALQPRPRAKLRVMPRAEISPADGG
jgi:hypothetical protein